MFCTVSVFHESTNCGFKMIGKKYLEFFVSAVYVAFITNIRKIILVKSPSKDMLYFDNSFA